MPGQKRLKDRPTGGFKHFFHSMAVSPSSSPNRPITPTQDTQTSSTPVGFKHFLHSLVPGRSRPASPNLPITPTVDPQASSTPVGPDPNLTHGIPDSQPPNSPSSNIYPSIVIPAGDKAPGGKADLASTVYQGVKTSLQLVERATDAFPPLKSTVAGLLGVIDIVEVRDFLTQ
jgi:hypothetical protein